MMARRRHITCQANDSSPSCGLDLAQAAALREHEFGEPALLGLREARRVGVPQQVGAVPVVVVVRDHHADLVQRTGPGELAHARGCRPRSHLPEEAGRHRGHALGLGSVHLEAALQFLHGRLAHVGAARAGLESLRGVRRGRRSRPGAARRAPAAARRCRSAWRGCRGWRKPPPSTAQQVVLQAGEREAVGAARLQALRDAPAQPVGGDGAVGDAVGLQQLRHRAGGAGRAQRLVHSDRREGRQGLLELGAGGRPARCGRRRSVNLPSGRSAATGSRYRPGTTRSALRRAARGRGSSRWTGRRCRSRGGAARRAAAGPRRRRSGALPRGRR